MANGRLSPVIRHLRRLVRPKAGDGFSDAHLLERFVHHGDEAAFELLLWRHGPMVWGLCRRILHDHHEAEDAFQATMLVLARKAGSIGHYHSVASWLYKVAYRIALRARAGSGRRARLEKQLRLLPRSEGFRDPEHPADLRQVIDEELIRLPEKYRAPVVLCYLQNKTNEEAAKLLRWPVGTVKTRLLQAREFLGQRLRRRGMTLSGAALAAVLAPPAAEAALPAGLLNATLGAAFVVPAAKVGALGLVSTRGILLMEGALKAMFFTKLKIAAAVLLVAGTAGTGVGLVSYHSLAAGQAGADNKSQSVSNPPNGKAPGDQQPPVLMTIAPWRLINDDLERERRAAADLEVAQAEVMRAENHLEEAKTKLQVARKRLEDIKNRSEDTNLVKRPPADPKQPVAYIFNLPVTREELADYLIAHYGGPKLEQLVNKLIIERACREKGIVVTPEEVNAAFQKDLKDINSTQEEFEKNVLSKYLKTLLEWREDVIKPRLCLEKLARTRVSVTEEDIRQAFESEYGEKVECRFILWPKGQEKRGILLSPELVNNPEEFDRLAKQQMNGTLAAQAGNISAIGHHATGNDALENAAFKLKPGEITQLETPEGTLAIKCLGRIPPHASKKLEDLRETLRKTVLDRKVQQEIPKLFKELREQAQPRLLLKK
jgi:RNA polymerase sigma factor (sigma-70 family)